MRCCCYDYVLRNRSRARDRVRETGVSPTVPPPFREEDRRTGGVELVRHRLNGCLA